MNTNIQLNVKIKGNEFLINDCTIPSDSIDDRMLDIFILGYRDAVNSRFDKSCYRRVNKIEYFEEFIYIEGYRFGGLDAKIGLSSSGVIPFDETYKESIKLSLQVCNFGDMLNADIMLLENLIEEHK